MNKLSKFEENKELKHKINTLEKKLKQRQSKKFDEDLQGKEKF